MFENTRKSIRADMLEMKAEDKWKKEPTLADGLKFVDCANQVLNYPSDFYFPEPHVMLPDWRESMPYSEDYDCMLCFEWRPNDKEIVTVSMEGDEKFVYVAIFEDQSVWRGELVINVNNLAIALHILQLAVIPEVVEQ